MLQDLLQHRRAVRYFDQTKSLDAERVRACLEQATLAPTSSNMQLWECYHITDRKVIQKLIPACLGQSAVATADQLVVFCITPQRWREHAEANLVFQKESIRRSFPEEKWKKYMNLQTMYYKKVVPFLYSRFGGLLGCVRKAFTMIGGLFRPIPREVSEGEMLAVLHKSCALVIQSFLLGMSEAGYDTCPIEGYDSHRVKRVLGLPGATELTMVIACGIRSEERPLGDRFRLPFDHLYHRIGD